MDLFALWNWQSKYTEIKHTVEKDDKIKARNPYVLVRVQRRQHWQRHTAKQMNLCMDKYMDTLVLNCYWTDSIIDAALPLPLPDTWIPGLNIY